jgi:hypothetical protein
MTTDAKGHIYLALQDPSIRNEASLYQIKTDAHQSVWVYSEEFDYLIREGPCSLAVTADSQQLLSAMLDGNVICGAAPFKK